MTLSISGKTAIVTGAANGIGLAIARHFAAIGANVMCADIDEDRLQAEFGDLAESDDASLRYFAGDLREKLTQANLLSATLDAFETVDILVNAARQIEPTDVLDPKDHSLEDLLEQNVTTVYRLSQLIARKMIALGKDNEDATSIGAIVNVSCIASQRAHRTLLGYSVSAAALEQLTRSMAVALADQRIRVNAVSFGSMMSAGLQAALKEDDAMREAITAATPLHRIAAPAELTEAVQFLASDGAGFVTGQVLCVDGGRSLVDAVPTAGH